MRILIAIMVLMLAPMATAGEFILGPAAVFSGEATMLTAEIAPNVCAASEVSQAAVGIEQSKQHVAIYSVLFRHLCHAFEMQVIAEPLCDGRGVEELHPLRRA